MGRVVRGHARPAQFIAIAILLFVTTAVPTPVAGGNQSWQYARPSAVQGRSPEQWILSGSKLPNGACRYSYPTAPTLVPESGWVLRTIGIDTRSCRKLFEEGPPRQFSSDSSAAIERDTVPVSESSDAVLAAAQQKSAWQRVIWRDAVGILVNAVMVQVNWTFNGTTVCCGSTNGAWQFNTATNWKLTAKGLTELYGAGSSYYRGQGTATFTNTTFCDPLPDVRTVYYYVRMWGHPNGTATRAQSSDSIDECLPLHVDIESAYGQWPG